MEMEEDKLLSLYNQGKIETYAAKMAWNMVSLSSTPFFIKFIKNKELLCDYEPNDPSEDYNFEKDNLFQERLDQVNKFLDEKKSVSPYYYILELYMKEKSMKTLSKKIGVSEKTLWTLLSKIKNEIKINIK